MAYLWKQLLNPTTPVNGQHYYAPYVQIAPSGNIVVAGALTASGYIPGGPDAIQSFVLAYDTFGNLVLPPTTVANFTVTTLPISYGLALPPTQNGGTLFYTRQDASDHWLIERAIGTANPDSTFSLQQDIAATLPLGSVVVQSSLDASWRPTDNSYAIGYEVYDSASKTVQLYEQGYNGNNSKATSMPVLLQTFTGVNTVDDAPETIFRSGAGGYVLGEEAVNASGHHYIHFQSYNLNGTTNTNIGNGTGHFDQNAANTNVTDITSIRFTQFQSNAFAIVDNEVLGTADRVVFRVAKAGATFTPTAFNIPDGAEQRVAIDNSQDPNNDIVYVAYGPMDGTGATIVQFNNAGVQVGTPFTLDDGNFRHVRSMEDGRVAVSFIKTLAGNVTTQEVVDIVDFRTAAVTTDTHTATIGDDFAGTMFADSFIGSDTARDRYAGAGAADKFIFTAAAFTAAQSGTHDTIVDYDQGNGGAYSAGEGDVIDISAIVHGQSAASVARLIENSDHRSASLQVDSDGAANGAHWVTLATLNGLKIGNTVNVVVQSGAAGTNLKVVGAAVANDFNGDGKSDVLFSQPGTNFNSDYQWQLNDRSLAKQGAVDLYDKAFSVQVIGDFNGDGKADVMFENPANAGVWQWQLNGTAIASQGPVDVGDPSFHILGSADFNGDGKDDLLWRSNTGLYYQWQMNGRVDTGAAVGTLDPKVWHAVGADDFTGDGKADILLHYQNAANAADPANGAFDIWQLDGNTVVATLGVERPDASWQTLGVGDFNGDGNADIAIRNVSNGPDKGAVWVYLMAGTVTSHQDGSKTADILAQGAAGIADAATWHVQQVGDLNGDGRDDILFRNDAGYFYSWDMNGTHIASEGLLQGAAQWADPALHVVTQHWDVA